MLPSLRPAAVPLRSLSPLPLRRPRPAAGFLLAGLLGTLGGLVLAGCRQAPMTGRAQLLTLPEQEELKRGAEAWREVLAREKLSTNAPQAQLVQRVGRRLAAVAGRPDFDWEFQLLASDQANAFCLPGGKVAVYEGLLPICENEAGLAVVMSHEIAHALARHGGERMSQQAAVKATGGLLARATQGRSDATRERWRTAYGLTTQYGLLLPYSRQHESEADSIGLTLMARAGYDPTEAPRFWERFAQASGPQPPPFLSTHPSDAQRVAHLRSLLPQALALYKAAPEQRGRGVAIATPASAAPGGEWGTVGSVQPASGAAAGTTPVQPAVAEEFVPPIQRPRAGGADGGGASPPDGSTSSAATSAAAPSPSAAAATPGEPPPFPELPASR